MLVALRLRNCINKLFIVPFVPCSLSTGADTQPLQEQNKATSNTDDIHVDSNLQDLFNRLAKNESSVQSLPEEAKISVPVAEALAVSRPRLASQHRPAKLWRKPPSLNPDFFVTIASTFGKAQHYHLMWHKMAAILVQFPERFLYRMNPEAVTKLACGYAQVKVQEPALFKEISAHSQRCISNFTPNQLTNLLWAFAELRQPGMLGLTEIIVKQSESRIADFTTRDLVRLLKTLGHLNHLNPIILSRFLPRLSISIQQQHEEQITIMLAPELLDVLSAVSGAISLQGTTSNESITTFLSTAAPLVEKRAAETQREWEAVLQQLQRGERDSKVIMQLQRAWEGWSLAINLYNIDVVKETCTGVCEALLQLKRLQQAIITPQVG